MATLMILKALIGTSQHDVLVPCTIKRKLQGPV